jgi:hypothetical protein
MDGEPMSETLEEQRSKVVAASHARGEFVQGDDGFYYWFPPHYAGCASAHHLRWLAEELDRLNEPLQMQLEEHFSKPPDESHQLR